MAVDPIDAEAFALQVECFYGSLISSIVKESWATQPSIFRSGINTIDSGLTPEPNLGGKLFFAAELDAEARALIVAANISGAATLAASADAEARKQAMRDGVVDFLVTTLDEALRILKNEVRKRETVAVCVAESSEPVEREMRERGVLADLQRPIRRNALEENQAILTWRVASAPSLWLPKIDAIASDCLTEKRVTPGFDFESVEPARRWLRFSPRYLGRLAQGVRVLRCSESASNALVQRVREAVESGEIGVAVEMKRIGLQHTHQITFAPAHS